MLKDIIAFIPARAGSKRIKDKNITSFYDKPLIYWTLKACEKSMYIKKIYVSTDSFHIIQTIRNLNITKQIFFCKRMKQNSLDNSKTEQCLLQFLKSDEGKNIKNVILLQCTSPLTTSFNLDSAIKLYFNEKNDVVSIVKLNRYIWEKVSNTNHNFLPKNYDLKNRLRTQDKDFKSVFVENGAFYISSKKKILKTKQRISGKINGYIMSEKHFLEIDTEKDLKALEAIKHYELCR